MVEYVRCYMALKSYLWINLKTQKNTTWFGLPYRKVRASPLCRICSPPASSSPSVGARSAQSPNTRVFISGVYILGAEFWSPLMRFFSPRIYVFFYKFNCSVFLKYWNKILRNYTKLFLNPRICTLIILLFHCSIFLIE